MHAGERAFTIELAGSLKTGAKTGMPTADRLEVSGATCSRVASFTATATLQQGGC
ncbi:MAG TPA: hypothetical protein VN874_06150 [Myxococcales bacterium]|nr:hypothetical protein [Myxococcales bacterium]